MPFLPRRRRSTRVTIPTLLLLLLFAVHFYFFTTGFSTTCTRSDGEVVHKPQRSSLTTRSLVVNCLNQDPGCFKTNLTKGSNSEVFNHKVEQVENVAQKIISKNSGLLSNLSSKTTEFKEYPGYFENFTYFQLNRSRVSDIPSQYSIPGASVCSGDVDLLVMIMSVKQHSDWRLLIRQTWASPIYDKSWSQKGLVRLVFFFGNEGFTDVENLALYNESKLYGDIVVASFKDSYGNLSLKLATALTWASKHCPHAKFVAKVDMDTFVLLPTLMELLQTISHNHTEFILGFQHRYIKPLVRRKGRWAVTNETYPYFYFPKYIYGHSYVISGPAVHKMAASFPFVHIVPNEDAFITGIMAVTLNITRLGNPTFAYSLKKYKICDLVYGYFVTAIYKKIFLKEIWTNVLNKNCSSVVIN
ncbi:beta-1,3-galactosyltransferase 5-like [Physella acuta]|uniref:beta-1,3-galactosyltransferase 5-like n=1 Tax=Physella acuta TaxID=109671 RepID=UPI0027DC2918|nr:beta-1,3-galactosyltransferase 5-like [Physella acuta]